MRSLPLRLSSVDGESLLGYIARYSHTFQFEPGDVVRALGLEPAAGGVLAAARHGVSLSAEQLEHAAFATGILAEVLKGMLLCRYAGRAFDQVPGGAAERQVWIWCSRFCPPCLCEDGAWRLAWQLGWTTVCVRHQVLLRVRCPQCARVPEVGPRRRWPHDHRGLLSDPSRCWRRHRHALCRVNLAAADATSVADDMELLAAQRRIDTLLDGQLEPTLADEQLAPPIYLRDLLALCNLLDRHGRVPDEAQPPVALRGRRLHDHPAELAAVLPGALALADLPDQEALADALREFADRRYHADGQTLTAARVGPVSATLKDALRRALTQTTWASRMGFDRGGHHRPDDLDDKLQARHVPQLFWADDYQRELAALFDFDYFTHWLGRRFCSVLLTRMLTPHDWHDAVRYLDLPERFVNDRYHRLFTALGANGRLYELASRVKGIANQHAQDGLVDYQQRRALLADWGGVSSGFSWLLGSLIARAGGRLDLSLRTRSAHLGPGRGNSYSLPAAVGAATGSDPAGLSTPRRRTS